MAGPEEPELVARHRMGSWENSRAERWEFGNLERLKTKGHVQPAVGEDYSIRLPELPILKRYCKSNGLNN